MSIPHISSYIYKLQMKIRDLSEVIDTESKPDLEKRLNTCTSMLERIIEQATDHNEDLGPYIITLGEIDKELRQIKAAIESKPKTFWESFFGFFANLLEGFARLLGFTVRTDRLLDNPDKED
ncbi:MAG: hypothetical protein R3D00_11895 [Bacteroidia bacterium]